MPITVAFTMRETEEPAYPEVRDALARDWLVLCDQYDLRPLLIPNGLQHPEAMMRDFGVSALVLTGGNGTPMRDETERRLVDATRDMDIPILGVCHGLQFLNAYFGGTVCGDVASIEEGHVAHNHKIALQGLLHEAIGETGIEVNSFHNFGVTLDGLAGTLRLERQTEGGLVEAFVHPEEPILAIQWHPEREPFDHPLNDFVFNHWIKTGGEG